MGKKYNEKDVITAFKNFFGVKDNEKILKNNKKWAELYDKKNKFVNWGGCTTDTQKPYIDIVAQCILDNIECVIDGNWNVHPARKYYWKKEHDIGRRKEGSNRREELTAHEIYLQNFDCLGKIIDYQTPLGDKGSQKHKCKIGNIDLLSYDDKNKKMRILEFKRDDNEETILRCILEAYTYKRFVDHVKENFLKDFEKPPETEIIPAILLYKSSKILEQRKIESIKKLIEILGIEIYTFYKDENKYMIERLGK